jgi:hypothetical protein
MAEAITEAGAIELAKTIRKFWRAKGYAPHVSVKAAESQHQIWVVRSDMVNGHPHEDSRLPEGVSA